jgi:tripartite-type tricarboxylate transporter receptor subunit TctC
MKAKKLKRGEKQMNSSQSWIRLCCAAIVALVVSFPAGAQDYPTKPVTIITPAAAGNSPDIVSRLIADRLTQFWKQQVIVLNRPGAGGLIAAQAAAQAEKDGYTLYMTQSSTWTVLPVLQEGRFPAEPEKSFVPIGMVGEQPMGVAVNKDVPAKKTSRSSSTTSRISRTASCSPQPIAAASRI